MYSGLCNQLYHITNCIENVNFNQTAKIPRFNLDIFKNEFTEDVLDLVDTSEKLKRININLKLTYTDTPPDVPIYPVRSIPILNCLSFNKNIIRKSCEIKELLKSYNGVHFRLDIDAIIHYTFGKEIYNQFMESSLKEDFLETLDQNIIKNYCRYLLDQYISFVSYFGFDKPWYICTSITKWDIHKSIEPYLKEFLDFILINNGTYYTTPLIYPQRELNALVDLLVLRDSERLIGFEGSSFSEGYCLKVNYIRKVTKEFLFVKS